VENVPASKRIGFRPYWCEQSFEFVAFEALKTLKKTENVRNIHVTPLSKPVFSAVFNYDTSVHIYPRRSFLEKWVFAPNCHSSVAIDGDGKVVGYGVVRTTLRDGDGWRIGPLFADSSAIAKSLYHDLCLKVAADDPKSPIAVDVPYGKHFDPDSLRLVTEMFGVPKHMSMRLYTKDAPAKMPLHKVFGITSQETG
jgi:hypothetical protein